MQCPSPGQDCPQAHAAAEEAVKRVFAILGVNIDEPKEVEEFRENLRFSATLRKTVEEGMKKGILTIVGLITVWIAATLWANIISQRGG